MSTCSVIRNIKNTCMKSFHTHALVSLVFMDFGLNLEVVLYQICMRYIICVWGGFDRHILFITMYFNSHILYGFKYKKLMCEKFAFPCHWITSAMTLASILKEYCIIFVGFFPLRFILFWNKFLFHILP